MTEEEKSGYITARVPESMRETLEKIAAQERRSVSQVIFLLLESALEQRNGKAGKK